MSKIPDDPAPPVCPADDERIAAAVMAERRRCVRIAAMFTVKPDRSIHPDIPWDAMSEAAKTIAHTTAQQIAIEIQGEG